MEARSSRGLNWSSSQHYTWSKGCWSGIKWRAYSYLLAWLSASIWFVLLPIVCSNTVDFIQFNFIFLVVLNLALLHIACVHKMGCQNSLSNIDGSIRCELSIFFKYWTYCVLMVNVSSFNLCTYVYCYAQNAETEFLPLFSKVHCDGGSSVVGA